MGIIDIVRTVPAAAALAALLPACGDSPNQPSTVWRLEIVGPSSLAPGESATYSATEFLNDGTSRTATSVMWASTDPSVLEITASGRVTARRGGEAVVSAMTTLDSLKAVLVLPTGTFRLVGVVSDANPPNHNIAEAIVEVAGGPAAISDGRGAYRLYGVPANAEIRVTRDGFAPFAERVQLSTHSTRDFRIVIDAGSMVRNYAGHYTLDLESSCAGVANPLADELRRRSYGARILQTGPLLEVKLSGAPFLYSGFYGYVTKAGATFVMYNDPYDFAAITEDLPDSSLLLIYGTATTTDSSTGLFGRFEGSFERLSGPPPMTAGKCPATSFSLVPK